jgi:septum formation protein
VLASGSPRRREILENLRVPFVVRAVAIDESTRPLETPAEYMNRIVAQKLGAARTVDNGDAWILVADTSVIDGDAIVGKPASLDDAQATIARLAGKTHEVWTRFALGRSSEQEIAHEQTVVTRVTFRALSEASVRAYAASGEGMDKAGGYAVQGLGAGLVSRIEGSYTNVVGLPACELVVALERLGLAW